MGKKREYWRITTGIRNVYLCWTKNTIIVGEMNKVMVVSIIHNASNHRSVSDRGFGRTSHLLVSAATRATELERLIYE